MKSGHVPVRSVASFDQKNHSDRKGFLFLSWPQTQRKKRLLACQEKAEQHVPEETHLSPINTEHTNLSRSKTRNKGGRERNTQISQHQSLQI
jgi:hypothetical protein